MLGTLTHRLAAIFLGTALGTTALHAQTDPRHGFVAAFFGFGLGHGFTDDAGLFGLTVRLPPVGRISGSATLTRWEFIVGCDLILGASCDHGAWSVDLGASGRLTPPSWPLEVALAARVGRLYYAGDRDVWDPSLGLEVIGRISRWLGWQLGVSYHAFTGARAPGWPYPPNAGDLVVLQGGLHFRP